MALKRMPVPREVELPGEGSILRLGWEGGQESRHPARELRLNCPCALCVDEMSGRRTLRPESVPADVRLRHAQRVGRYALQLTFSDGHSTGIFTYESLRAWRPDPDDAPRGDGSVGAANQEG